MKYFNPMSLMHLLFRNNPNSTAESLVRDSPEPTLPMRPKTVFRHNEWGMKEGIYRFVYEGRYPFCLPNSYFDTQYFLSLTSSAEEQTLVERLEMFWDEKMNSHLRIIPETLTIHDRPLLLITPIEVIRPYADLQKFEPELPALWYEKNGIGKVVEK